jgi:alkanesulfonate monooxygenase SsuD/methylene tetrahydromethanopterin reductase-like flavin-dependent oxidoreductase (luciferase family)
MKFDVFFSICQTPVDGHTPSEKIMFQNFFDQVILADALGFETAWLAETHLSCQIQKENKQPVVPEFKGEIGLNTDVLQMAHLVFAKTKNINVGSAIRNILCNGGPIAHAEAIKTFLTLHGLNPDEKRKLNIGFAAGRFPFSVTPYGILPRDSFEEVAWPIIKSKIFLEATEIMLRLLKSENISSNNIAAQFLLEKDFRTSEHWQQSVAAYEKLNGTLTDSNKIPLKARWEFEKVGVIPFEAPLELLDLTVGSHDPVAQALANDFFDCGVFNLSITPSKIIESTHERMSEVYKKKNKTWNRDKMPRTVLVFLSDDTALDDAANDKLAKQKATKAVENYWKAMANTIDQQKIDAAVDNSIFGSPKTVIEKLKEKYNSDERLMIWFDFNNHDNEDIKQSMTTFMKKVKPKLGAS